MPERNIFNGISPCQVVIHYIGECVLILYDGAEKPTAFMHFRRCILNLRLLPLTLPLLILAIPKNLSRE
jgi:hypothetical protein